MEPFQRLESVACPLPLSSVDTDQLIPARFMKTSRDQGYGRYLLHDLRFDAEGRPQPGFPLDDPAHEGAMILVARRNFGAGSSREAAVYALVDFGIRCVVAPSFGDIFAANAVNNGLLPATVEEAAAERLLMLAANGSAMTVDLEARTIEAGGETVRFDIDPVWRTKLLNGWDDIDLTERHREAIEGFVRRDAARRPWAVPTR